jgi:hypothetical protein
MEVPINPNIQSRTRYYQSLKPLIRDNTQFNEDWFRHSKVDRKGYTETGRRSHKPTLGKQAEGKGLKV